jgi:PAS domain S-box-containing protein
MPDMNAETTMRLANAELKKRIALLDQTLLEKERVTAALHDSEKRYRRLFESAKDGILILDAASGKVVDVNPFLLQLLDLSYETVCGRYIWEMGAFKDIAASRDAFKTLQDHDYVRYEHLPLVTQSGQSVAVEFVSNVYDVDHTRVIQCNIRDITERVRSADALRESQELLHGVFDSMPVRVFWKDRDLVFRGCNAAFARDAGFEKPEDIIGKDDHAMCWREQADLYQADDRAVIEGGEAKLLIEETQTTPSGERIHLLTSKVPLRAVDGTVVGLLGTYLDITKRVELENRLRQSEKMETVGRLAGGIAHDFNNLLTVINGTAELAALGRGEDDPVREQLANIRSAGERAADLTRQLLAFSRRQVLQPVVMKLNDTVVEIEPVLRRLIGEDVHVSVQLAADLDNIRIDRTQVEQILLNLASNSRDAMPNGGTLTIETANVGVDELYASSHATVQSGPQVMLAISDTGHGMDEATRQRVFEPFFTTKATGRGTGLGLATVYGIVKQCGGSIWVYSEVGRGTTIKVYFPRTEESVRESAPTPVVALERGAETILVVEDEEAIRYLVREVLEAHGYTVLDAANGREALELLEGHEGPVQLLLTDVVMPDMGGRELADQLQASHPGMKVLYTSGYTDDAIVHFGVLEEGAHFIGKPYSIVDLTSKVREVLDS